jgi:hypothetical protein
MADLCPGIFHLSDSVYVMTSLKWARLIREPIAAALRLDVCQSLATNSSKSADRWSQVTAHSFRDTKWAVSIRRKQVDELISDVRRSSAVIVGQAAELQRDPLLTAAPRGVEYDRRWTKMLQDGVLSYHTASPRRCGTHMHAHAHSTGLYIPR